MKKTGGSDEKVGKGVGEGEKEIFQFPQKLVKTSA
jgi:hypothetical protein